MRILPEIANLMYQITALMLSKQRRDHAHREPENQSDEAQEREEVIRTDMVQSMLEKVLTLLCNLVRSKKELAERVGSHSAHCYVVWGQSSRLTYLRVFKIVMANIEDMV